MSENQMVQKNDPNEVVVGGMTRGEVATLKQTLTPQGINDAQFNLFIQTCAASGLNPFMNHIYAIPYKGKMNIQISVEGIHFLARKHPEYITASGEVIGENEVENFEAELVDGEFKILKHKIALPLRGKAVAAYAIAKRKGAPDQVVFMDRSEVEHLEKGINPLWKSNFNDMFKKHVLKRALKAQFGVDIDDHTVEGSVDSVQDNARRMERKEISIEDGESIDEEDAKTALINEIKQDAGKFGFTDKQVNEIAQERFQQEINELSIQKLAALKKFVELEGQRSKAKVKEAETIEASFEEIKSTPTEAPVEQEKEQYGEAPPDMMSFEMDFDEDNPPFL
ncbi:RecT family recombinase [Peribacillus sp. B-H-3]|uniref:RecT family recombinase n=1 Tax=Peribacillus sp. B-H-3 TaxID=3400420 RepID=UPI003B022989